MDENAASFLQASGVSCQRALHSASQTRVWEVSLAIEPGTLNVLWGAAGCGKNLLLRLLGLLETPDAGDVLLHGTSTRGLSEEARLDLRQQHFGFVFNEPFLIDAFTVVENVAMPLFKIARANVEEARQHVDQLLEFVGLRDQAQTVAGALSLLDQHKVSLARALVNRPDVLIVEDVDAYLADHDLMAFGEVLLRAKSHFGLAVIMSALTNDVRLEADRAIQLIGGKITHDTHPVSAGGARA